MIRQDSLARNFRQHDEDLQPCLPIFKKQDLEPSAKLEVELYEPLLGFINFVWAPEQEFREHLVEVTAFQGRKSTGGLWSRPDLVCIGAACYEYLPGCILDVTTFEVKRSVGDAIAGIYETVAHSAFAHRSILMIQVNEVQSQTEERALARITSEARRMGLGLIAFIDESKWTTFETLVEARHSVPPPSLVNKFIGTQISEENRTRVITMIK